MTFDVFHFTKRRLSRVEFRFLTRNFFSLLRPLLLICPICPDIDGADYLQDSIYDYQECHTINVTLATDCLLKVNIHDIRDYENEEQKIREMDAFFVVFSEYVQESFTLVEECLESILRLKLWTVPTTPTTPTTPNDSSSSNNNNNNKKALNTKSSSSKRTTSATTATAPLPILILNHLFTSDSDDVPSTQITQREMDQITSKYKVRVSQVITRQRTNMDQALTELIQNWLTFVHEMESGGGSGSSSGLGGGGGLGSGIVSSKHRKTRSNIGDFSDLAITVNNSPAHNNNNGNMTSGTPTPSHSLSPDEAMSPTEEHGGSSGGRSFASSSSSSASSSSGKKKGFSISKLFRGLTPFASEAETSVANTTPEKFQK